MKFQRIYFEEKIKNHPRTKKILNKFENIPRVKIENYGEVFFRKNQNFSLQKKFPSLILAKRENLLVQKMPEYCPAPRKEKYYFSYMLGCIANCEYCYLKGSLPSGNIVIFVNYEDFFEALPDGEIFVSTAFENDSLALENIARFIPVAKKYAESNPGKLIELRSKFTNINILPKDPPKNLILSLTITDEGSWDKYEKGSPSPKKRIEFAKNAKALGWKIAFHFDPLFDKDLPNETLSKFKDLAYFTKGALRMPDEFLKKAHERFPESKTFLKTKSL